MELIFRVHLLYVECYVHFFTLILHKDFVREIVLQCFTEDGLGTQGRFGVVPWILQLRGSTGRGWCRARSPWLQCLFSFHYTCLSWEVIPERENQKYGKKIALGFTILLRASPKRNPNVVHEKLWKAMFPLFLLWHRWPLDGTSPASGKAFDIFVGKGCV